MGKTDDQLRSDIAANESRAEWGAWLVVGGLALEIVLATAKSLGYERPIIENWGGVLADCLIALGVYSEIHFGRRASNTNTELRRRSDERVAAANARAADAELRTELLHSAMAYNEMPRSLDENTFVEVIKNVSVGSIEILYDHSVPDALLLGMMYAAALQKATWNVLGVNAVDPTKPDKSPMGIPEPYIIMGRGSPWGISIISKDDPRTPGNFIISKSDTDPLWTELKGQAAALAKATLDSGADRFASIGTDKRPPENIFRLVIGAKRRIWPGSGPIPGVRIPMPNSTQTTNTNERVSGE
jgi:hypothetical protein